MQHEQTKANLCQLRYILIKKVMDEKNITRTNELK